MNEDKLEKTYYVEGFSCASCANTFEKNVKSIKGVNDASVNFGASKITVSGNVSIKELEKAGAFENLKIKSDRKSTHIEQEEGIYKKYQTLIYSVVLLGIGFLSTYINGDDNLITILLFILTIIISGYNLIITGVKNLFKLTFDMKTLMTIAVIGGILINQFSEVALIVILFALSEELERYSMDKARKSIKSLVDIAPNEAIIKRDGQELVVNVNEIKIDDLMIIRPGDKIAMDGVILDGNSSVNQAAITGESMPLKKTINDLVYAGTLNEEGLLEVRVTKLFEDSTLSKIIDLVEEAQGKRAPAQAFVDKFAKYYTPIIMIIALLVMIIPPIFFSGEWSKWLYQGLAVLVVGCPCALVISTPISIVSAIGNAAKEGVLVKGGIYLEEMGKAKTIAFDKTGTLTEGMPSVSDFYLIDQSYSKEELFEISYLLEKNSSHPIAKAINEYAIKLKVNNDDKIVSEFKSLPGLGLSGVINNENYLIGNTKLFDFELDFKTLEVIKNYHDSGKTIMLVGTKKLLIGIIAVSDQIRLKSKTVIEELNNLGLTDLYMLTGDNQATAKAIKNEININNYRAELMPEDKLNIVNELKINNNKVIMIGDGVNDAPALASATVGIAMGRGGTDTALETADVVFMNDDLRRLPYIIRLSRKTLRIIKANITFAISIKVVALLLVVPGWLTLWIAILSDMGATLIVALNSMRLIKKDKKLNK